MFDLQAYSFALASVTAVAMGAWIYSVLRRNVSIVDSLWSLMMLLCLLVYLSAAGTGGPRSLPVLIMLAIWALRLSGYITMRNHGQPEDRRYQAIRRNNKPGFQFKSLYIVFLLQAVLAWVICLPALAAVSAQTAPGPLDYVGFSLWLSGMFFQVVGDYQLTRFRGQPGSQNQVLKTGLWRYTRHPNYFGEAVLWWGFYLIALSAGAWWAIVSPLLMTFLLLRVSGVALLEKDIPERRPAYLDYIRNTNAFFPGRPQALRVYRN
jgi:steroid 5-alpha reductase family enzyme